MGKVPQTKKGARAGKGKEGKGERLLRINISLLFIVATCGKHLELKSQCSDDC